jgi:hypothetical protein
MFEVNETVATILTGFGLLGDVFIIGSYLLMQCQRLNAQGAPFLLCNIIGSLLVISSLLAQWSATLCFIQVSWLSISIFGFYSNVIAKKAKTA